MAEVRPFRALYYDTDKVGDAGRVIAPPYDVIDESQRLQLLSSHPRNIVRLILPENPADNRPWQDVAAATYSRWRDEGVFRLFPQATVYVYRQTFKLDDRGDFERLAIIALYRLQDQEDGGIYPHEKTFPQVTREQLRLLSSCRASFSQVFALFRDNDEYRALLRGKALASGQKILDFRFPASIGNQLIALKDRGLQREIASMVGEGGVFIADGHHRYETALAFRRECRSCSGDAGGELPCDFISMAFVGINDPGLLLLPVHRLLSGTELSAEDMLRSLSSEGFLEEVKTGVWEESVRETCCRVINNEEEDPIFGVVTPGRVHIYRPDIADAPADDRKGAEADSRLLDVTVLHRQIIGRTLGLPETGDVAGEGFSISYTVDLSEIMEAISAGKADIAFLQRSPSLEQAWSLAVRGQKMPHKSTYFYPKMPSGLAIYDHRFSLTRDSW